MMDKIKIFFEEHSIPKESYILGRGCSRRKGRDGRKDRYYMNTQGFNSNVIFVVQYSKDIRQFIAWMNTRNGKQCSCFSVIADDIILDKKKKFGMLKKGKEFVNNDDEIVYTFKEDGIQEFITVFKRELERW